MALPAGLILEVIVDYKDWLKDLPDAEVAIISALEQFIEHVPEGKKLTKFTHLELGIVLCNDDFIKNLNSRYRSQEKATNVLSFEGLAPEQTLILQNDDPAPEFPLSLGEVYIAHETLVKEASDAGISLHDHFVHLVLHGLLHLVGYDHIEDEDAEVMEALETRLLGHLAIDDPYAA